MVCVPVPAVAGLKLPAVTPVPEYVPPAGKPPERAKSAASTHTFANAASVTTGKAFTVIVLVAELTQLFPSVYV